MIYVIGHKNPDTDTVISSITYSYLMGAGYEPVISGELNAETKFVLEKFNINSPEKAKLISDSDKFFLVDHNEKT